MNTIEKAIALAIVLVFVWVALKKLPPKHIHTDALFFLCGQ
ncbi:hypothetical protein [Allobaculum sp. JKK-2023]|nr:hypothetical protein [Allobaculum sp. JKK-2023]